jgi:hypothetical protein
MNDWGRIAVMVVIIAAVIGIVLVALNVFGVAIPSWAVTIFWIIVVAAVAIGAIKLLIRWMP